MPERFSSEWEYYVADPEIEELIQESGKGITMIERSYGDDTRPGLIETGISVIRRTSTLLTKRDRREYTRKYKTVPCPQCHEWFVVRRTKDHKVYCTKVCKDRCALNRRNAKKQKQRGWSECKNCNEWFEKLDKRQLYCTRKCALKYFNDRKPRKTDRRTNKNTR